MSTVVSIWFTTDKTVEQESVNGNVTVRLKGRYQSCDTDGNPVGYPNNVINIWGLSSKEMRELIKFSKANPFTCVSIIGNFSERVSTTVGSSNSEHLSNARIDLDKESNWILKRIPRDVIPRHYATPSTHAVFVLIWFMADEIVEKESTNGNVTVRLRGRYQSCDTDGNPVGFPNKVINIWGLSSTEMRELIKFSKANPFTCVSIIGNFSEPKSLSASGITSPKSESLSYCRIEYDDKGEMVTLILNKADVIKRHYAKSQTLTDLETHQSASKSLQIKPKIVRHSTKIEAIESIGSEEEQTIGEM